MIFVHGGRSDCELDDCGHVWGERECRGKSRWEVTEKATMESLSAVPSDNQTHRVLQHEKLCAGHVSTYVQHNHQIHWRITTVALCSKKEVVAEECEIGTTAKKAILVGINYPRTKAKLRGCINDVWRIHRCLIEKYDFYEHDITVLIDTDESYMEPNGKNIRSVLTRLVQSAEPGDVLFMHYSGHGTRLLAKTREDGDTSYDECIVPSDMNLIIDDDYREFVVRHTVEDTVKSRGVFHSTTDDDRDIELPHKQCGYVKNRILGLVGSLAQEFLKQKLDSNDGGGYAKPAMETKVERKYEAYVGSSSMKPRLSKRRNFDEWPTPIMNQETTTINRLLSMSATKHL
ncbi:hypothetical protein JHK84_043414 [Glycine max]|nr:hypothetical protein JHK84_043414 [Glycine max]